MHIDSIPPAAVLTDSFFLNYNWKAVENKSNLDSIQKYISSINFISELYMNFILILLINNQN